MSNERNKSIENSTKITEMVNNSVSYSGLIQALQNMAKLSISEKEQIKNISSTMTGAMTSMVSKLGIDKASIIRIGSVLQNELAKISNQYTDKVASMRLEPTIMGETLRNFSYQSNTIKHLVTMPQTKMVTELQGYVSVFNLDGCVNAISQTLGNSMIHASDLAFARNTDFGQGIIGLSDISEGIQKTLKKLNSLTAMALEHEEQIMYDVPMEEFTDDSEKNFSVRANIDEMNSIAYAFKSLNDGILNEEREREFATARELMGFMTVLSETRTFASEHIVGRRIFKRVRDLWDAGECASFEKEYYYHARAYEEGDAPYVYQDMLKAPHGVTGPGRYNFPGEAYYYTADTAKGAENEVRLHNKNKRIQVVKLKPRSHAKLLDLTVPARWGHEFLKYVRFNAEGSMALFMPRQYLIPNFISDCCRKVGFDGIKYYGGKDYNNYVTWIDGYFEYVEMM